MSWLLMDGCLIDNGHTQRQYVLCEMSGGLPQAFIIPAEVEPRFSFNPLLPPNHKEESFKARRRAFNQAVNRNRDKHLMLRLADLLCDRDYFTWNGVHLEDLGNKVYWSALKGCLKEAIPKLSL